MSHTRPTQSKLRAWFAPVVCQEMDKGQKLAARLAEGANAQKRLNTEIQEQQKKRCERDLAGTDEFNAWREEYFKRARSELTKSMAREAGKRSRLLMEENSWHMPGPVLVLQPPVDSTTAAASAAQS